jgi:glycosyltransferase involved in cell wall biosynthesis
MASFNKLTIIVPVYNEEKTLKKSLRRLLKAKLSVEKQIIVVDDGSTDNSRKILLDIKDKNIQVITHKINKGKGAAIRSALKLAKGEYTIVHDADLEYDPNDIENLTRMAKTGGSDAVLGSRNLSIKNTYLYGINYQGVRLMSWIINTLHHCNKLTDPETCYKLINTKLLRSLDLQEKGFGIEIEAVTKLCSKKIRIIEVPISYSPRSYKDGKKIKWTDGVKGIFLIFKYSLH